MNKLKVGTLSLMILGVVCSAAQASEIFDPQAQIAHSKEMIGLSNEKEIKAKQLEIAVIQHEIDKLNVAPSQGKDAANPDSDKQVAELQKTIEVLKSQQNSGESQVQPLTQAAYYTGYMEFSGKKQAEMIADGSRKVVSVGEEIAAGETVRSINESTVTTSSKSGVKTYVLQSNAQIAQKIYASAMKDSRGDGESNGGHRAMKLNRNSDDD